MREPVMLTFVPSRLDKINYLLRLSLSGLATVFLLFIADTQTNSGFIAAGAFGSFAIFEVVRRHWYAAPRVELAGGAAPERVSVINRFDRHHFPDLRDVEVRIGRAGHRRGLIFISDSGEQVASRVRLFGHACEPSNLREFLAEWQARGGRYRHV